MLTYLLFGCILSLNVKKIFIKCPSCTATSVHLITWGSHWVWVNLGCNGAEFVKCKFGIFFFEDIRIAKKSDFLLEINLPLWGK